MTTLSLAASRIGRHGTTTNIGSSIISRSWNQKSVQNFFPRKHVSSSIRRYAILTDVPTMSMLSSSSQLGVKTSGYNFFFSLRDLASSVLQSSLVGVRGSAGKETTSKSSSVLSLAIWLIKRTYQPSLLKKKRQCGYMKRRQSVGGRRILKRRRKKGRKRLFGA